nr:uncharacterized protein LOC114925688 isoform X2 [Arachis hypogaea]
MRCTCTSKYTHTAEERIENGSQRREERKDALALVVLATAVAAKPTARERESSLKRDASERERARTLSLPSMEPRAASLSPREERARAGGAVEEVIGCEAKIIFVDNGFQFGVLELACKIYSPRTLKAVAIENPNDADQAAEIVLSELHRDLILPLPWKSWKFKNKSKTRQKFKTEIETCSCIFIVNKKRRYERARCKF